MHATRPLIAVSTAALIALGACGRTPSPQAGQAAAQTTAAPATTARTMSVTPPEALRDGQVVNVVGKGFTPNASLIVVQCADSGEATGPGDCNLAGMRSVTADATGAVAIELPVAQGPFGSNGVTCAATTKCLVAVSTASRTESASSPISFAAP